MVCRRFIHLRVQKSSKCCSCHAGTLPASSRFLGASLTIFGSLSLFYNQRLFTTCLLVDSLSLPFVLPCQSLLTLVLHSIVFVHGLNGHPYHTWATHKPETFWPADLLPSALEEQHVRILTYGYDANVGVFTDGASKDKIHNHAEHLASRLTANRSVS